MGLCVATSYFRQQLLSFAPLPRRHRLRISPQAFLSLSCVPLQAFQPPAIFDECNNNDVGAIQESQWGASYLLSTP
jgi:hypothetical protein